MKPDHNRRNKMLAAEYVLGTLRAGARRRFERWLLESAELRRDVWYWERRLGRLQESLPVMEQTPPERVWRNIRRRLSPEPARRARDWWRPLAAAAAIAALVFVALRFGAPGERGHIDFVAVMKKAGAPEPAWVIDLEHDDSLVVRALGIGRKPSGKDFQLWILPPSGAPLALPVLPVNGGERRFALDAEQARSLRAGRRLAVSLEPRGGSPTGEPSGPVVYSARLRAPADHPGV